MNLEQLIDCVELARNNFINVTSGLTYNQSSYKISLEEWCISEVVEHMVWAEQGGINGIWKTIEGIKNSKPVWEGEAVHYGLSIEQVIERTWRTKEEVPENAKPCWGGPLDYWINSLKNCQHLLRALSVALNGFDLERVIYPHIISGPLNVNQRMEFLRFHLERHQLQIENIKTSPYFPHS